MNEEGKYTIKAKSIKILPANLHVYLIDMLNSISQDLTLNPAYEFTMNQTEDNNRFYIKFAEATGINSLNNKSEIFNAYSNDKTLYVNFYSMDGGKGQLSIYNMAGQIIRQPQLISSGQYNIELNQPTGIYLVRMITDKKVYVKKVLIN